MICISKIRLKDRHIVYRKAENRFLISIPPAVGKALIEDGVKKVDIIIIVPESNNEQQG